MSGKNDQCLLRASVDEKEWELFEAMARSLDVSCNELNCRLQTLRTYPGENR
jgi:hypothetical protein